MSGPAKPQSSRWGSFLQQAVAGVESRLDKMLDETEDGVKPARSPTPAAASLAPAPKSENVSRTPSTRSARGNDRLQERLARAMAAKNAANNRSESSPRQSRELSRSDSPARIVDSPRSSIGVASAGEERTSLDIKDSPAEAISVDDKTHEEIIGSAHEENDAEQPEESRLAETKDLDTIAKPSIEISAPDVRDASIVQDKAEEEGSNGVKAPASTELPEVANVDYKALLEEVQSSYEKSELERQEEIHGYIERIDALQAKLQYLARESAESARSAASAAPGSVEKKLAAKDEQIALLMEEGQKLSKTELKHLTLIKKLRAKIAEDAKETVEIRKKADNFDDEKAALLERIRRAELFEKQSNTKSKTITQLHKEIEALKLERDAKNSAIAELKTELDQQASQAKEAEVKAVQDLLDTEKKRTAALEEELSGLRLDKELAAEQSRTQIKELRDKMERDAERARALEIEMRGEQQMLESKLEVIRARAEEVSSGATGDAQAKLLRQIETLQTQYSVASENWQGIEASLVARATGLEKERDEASKREADVRRKAREMALKSKRTESDLEDARSTIEGLQKEISDYKNEVAKLKKRIEEVETSLKDVKKTYEDEKESWKSDFQAKIDEERIKWREDFTGPSAFGRADSPNVPFHRGSSADFLTLQNSIGRKFSARSITSDIPPADRYRQGTPQRSRSPDPLRPQRQDSMQSLPTSVDVPPTPSLPIIDQDDMFDERMDSPKPQTINDMISVSTVGAGPSVQLVERMSAAVRRLESEKVATKEELARLTTQRNDARAEIMKLMQEVEAKRTADQKIEQLEADLEELNSRYNTTLELLGEKSEMVDELQADVQDVKAMYRELVERTVR